MPSIEKFKAFSRRNPSSNDKYAIFPQKINQIGDKYWFIEIDSSTERNRNRIFDWAYQYRKQPLEHRILAQEYALMRIKGHTNPDTGRIVMKSLAGFYKLSQPCKFFQLILSTHPNFEAWRSLSISDILQCIVGDLNNSRNRASKKGCLTTSTGFARFQNHMKIIRDFGGIARSINPFSATLSTDIPSSKDIVGEYLNNQGISYSHFRRRGNVKTIPTHIATAWLAYIIQELTSEKFKIWQAYWIFLRKYSEHHKLKNFPNVGAWKGLVNTFYRYQNTDFCFSAGWRLDNHNFLVSSFTESMIKTVGYVPTKKQIMDVTDTGKRNSRQLEVTNYLRHLYSALAMTSGARRSELAYIRLSEFREVTDRTSNFTSFIHKTNAGLPTIRSIAGFAHQMAKGCALLGTKDRGEEGVYLFYAHNNFYERPTNAGVKALYFNDSYQLFLQSLPKTLAREFKSEVPTVHSHQARHLFAAFALRVSDGNVFEAIRKHFRHQLGSPMTKTYIDHKLNEDEAAAIEKDYIKEIVRRIGDEKDYGYFGPMVSRIEKLIDENIKFWDANKLDKLSEQIDRIADRFHAVKVHEWGLCLTLNDSLTKSKCYNQTTKLPDYDQGSTFKNCASCIHMLSHNACREDIERIGISAHQTLSHHPVLGDTIREELGQTIKQVKALLGQMVDRNKK